MIPYPRETAGVLVNILDAPPGAPTGLIRKVLPKVLPDSG